MGKKVLVIYYTQSGQLLDIVRSVVAFPEQESGIETDYEELRPKPAFPFPWTADEFFQAFPESVQGIPCELEPYNVADRNDYDLIIIAWQPWYLSPSIPVHAFFQNPAAGGILSGKPVVTVTGARNMWVMGQQKIREYILANGGLPVGNIVLVDRAPNLLSVISIMRWMFTGKRERYLGIIPPAGVSKADIDGAARFGPIISEALLSGNYGTLRERLIAAGAVDVKPALAMIEKRGRMIFNLWARFVLKKESYGSIARAKRLRAFKYYLLAVIYLVSPFAALFYHLTSPFRRNTIQKQITLYQSL
ncbi:MAG: hypothetical protein JXA61_00260 [Bacteroidales bacterium]|nr:hypothetical protein [Bacteroidales bacterium]